MNARPGLARIGLAAAAMFLLAQVLVAQEMPAPKPTAEHEQLAADAGTWDATIKVWEPGGQSEPAVSKGVETNRRMPGGLWMLSEFHGQFGGVAFHGQGQTGYDPLKKKYVGTWVDSLSPSMMVMEGDLDPKTNTLVMHAKGTAPNGSPYEAP